MPTNSPILTTNLLNILVNEPSDSPTVFNTEDKNIPQSKHKSNTKNTKQKQKGQSKTKKGGLIVSPNEILTELLLKSSI
jgi:hypothetical protein